MPPCTPAVNIKIGLISNLCEMDTEFMAGICL